MVTFVLKLKHEKPHKHPEIRLTIGDLGMGGVKGGTPGWVAPEFMRQTIPGVSDVYSAALVILYMLTVKNITRDIKPRRSSTSDDPDPTQELVR